MGSDRFRSYSSGKTPEEAFIKAVKKAKYDYGHHGYSGTIAEKDSFQLATLNLLSDEEANVLADNLELSTFFDKWGPAGCIPLESKSEEGYCEYLFFGWASS